MNTKVIKMNLSDIPERYRGIRPPAPLFKVPPMTKDEADQFIKLWKACIPKMSELKQSKSGDIIVYGTAGEQPKPEKT